LFLLKLAMLVDYRRFGHCAFAGFYPAKNEIMPVPSFDIEMPGDYADDACLVIAELYSSASSI
jgi:hypothetical protein